MGRQAKKETEGKRKEKSNRQRKDRKGGKLGRHVGVMGKEDKQRIGNHVLIRLRREGKAVDSLEA